jgi:uncharacterized membrane protein YfcA
MSFLLSAVSFAGIGSLSGFLNGLFGVGGGTVMVPFLIFWLRSQGAPLHQASIEAIFFSLVAMIPTSLLSFFGHRRKGHGSFKKILLLFAGGFPGAYLGAELALLWKGSPLVLAFAFLEFLIGLSIFCSPSLPSSSRDRKIRGFFLFWIATGFLSGLLSSLFGIGGGILAVPLQVLILSQGIHSAIANSTGLIVLNASVGVGRYLLSGALSGIGENLLFPIILAGTALLSSPAGVRLSHRFQEDQLRRIYGVFLIVMAFFLTGEALRGIPNDHPTAINLETSR